MAITDPGAFSVGQKLTAALMNTIRNALLSFLSFSSYTPTLAQGASSNISKTVNYANYVTLGKIGIVWVRLAATAAGTAGSTITITTPWTMATSTGIGVGSGAFYDLSTTTFYNGQARILSTTTIDVVPDGAAAGAGAGLSPNVAVASGDLFEVFAVVPLA